MEQRKKRYVAVTVRFSEEGKIRPLQIELSPGHQYNIDKILDVRRAACESVGGVGEQYTCRINGQETYLWIEKGRWFVVLKR